jgi:hypothetical protein
MFFISKIIFCFLVVFLLFAMSIGVTDDCKIVADKLSGADP